MGGGQEVGQSLPGVHSVLCEGALQSIGWGKGGKEKADQKD